MNKKILLVEDLESIHELYVYILRKKGYNTISARDGEEALLKARENPDLILLDVMIPKIDGITVLKRLQAEHETQSIPVILLTNLADDDIISDAFRAGAKGYLLKVLYKPAELIQLIEDFLNNPSIVLDSRNE